VEALRCAIALQAAVAAWDAAGPHILLRIGLALGDVVAEGGDLYGDGVNVAARLEALAEPGGILVAAAIAEQAHGRVDCGLEDAGPLALKNIPQPVPAFRIRASEAVDRHGVDGLSRHASLLVLPFANLDDPADEQFATGLTEEVTTVVARIRWLAVIARTATSTHSSTRNRDRSDIRQSGRELGARYVLAGSVRRSSGHIRVIGQLVDVETGRQVWADRFDGDAGDAFTLQDTVARAISGVLEPELMRAELERERRRPGPNPNAYELCMRALTLLLRVTRDDSEASMALAQRALALDPDFVTPKLFILAGILQRATRGWSTPQERETAVRMAREAFATHGDDPNLLAKVADILGIIALDLDGSLDAASRAVALNPNSCWTRMALGWAHIRIGEPDTAIPHFEQSLRIHPYQPDACIALAGLGYAHFMQHRIAEALACIEKALRQMPGMPTGHRLLIACLMELGRHVDAEIAAQRFLQVIPNARADPDLRRCYRDQGFAQRLIDACRAAGLPD
jgi:adenylate cyclase